MTFSQLLNANGERTDRKGRKVGRDGFTEMQQNPCGMTPTSCVPAVSRKEDFKGDGNDVGALVAKSKKAAASLYTLLHAKVGSFCHVLQLQDVVLFHHQVINTVSKELQDWC